MSEKILEVIDLEVHYDKIRALKGVSFDVNAGEIVALLGANGAGKSTTLLAISGILKSSNGKILFKGKEIQSIRPDKIVRMGIAQAPEGRHIYPMLTVADNLKMGAIIRKDRSAIAESMDSVLTLFPRLKERASQMAGTLSGGEQQMLTIGRAMMSKPELLILDEPSLGISPILTAQIFDTIKEINNSGLTILLVEQNASAALSLANRAYVLETGKVAISGLSQDLSNNPKVRKAYLGG